MFIALEEQTLRTRFELRLVKNTDISTSRALSAGVEEYSGEGSKAGAFTGKGYVLGDGSSTTPPRTLAGNLEIGTELKIFLALIAGYLLLMYYSKNPI